MLHEFDVRDDCTNTAQIGVEFYSIEEWNRIEHAAKQYWPPIFVFFVFCQPPSKRISKRKDFTCGAG